MKKMLCSNPWCKATCDVNEDYESKECPKCLSFGNDMSGGVTWTEKKYEGSRFDGHAHQIDIKVQRAFENKNMKW